ncbi:5E5 antigen-like, partial [Ruditapes philippinarum]|uniref:5E5 antigen-like n=1 Tax=Ruditapes philippinarum TaxID=129788 RepID=UPI00295B72FD
MDTESNTSSASGHSLRGVFGGGVRGTGRGRGGGRVGRRGGRGGRRGGRRGSIGGRGQVAQGSGTGQVARGRGAGQGARGRGAESQAGRGVVRPAETEDERKERVKGLVESLGGDAAKEILCMAVDRQPGLILDILDRIEPAQPAGFHPQPGSPSPSWCCCSKCRDMPTVEERVCCGYTPEYCLSQLPV